MYLKICMIADGAAVKELLAETKIIYRECKRTDDLLSEQEYPVYTEGVLWRRIFD